MRLQTEVALRAAFLVAMSGKQVAVLVPTTVLAQQHYDTFSRRMMAFPATVEVISRFRSPKEQEQVVVWQLVWSPLQLEKLSQALMRF